MLLKDLVGIKPGTLIKGLRITNTKRYIDIDGWKLETSNQLKPIFEEENLSALFYPDYSIPENIKPVKFDNIKDKVERFVKKRIPDPWYEWDKNKVVDYKFNDPIGIHLGEFIFSYYKPKLFSYNITEHTITVYSKMLLSSAEVGYFLFTVEDWKTEEMELA